MSTIVGGEDRMVEVIADHLGGGPEATEYARGAVEWARAQRHGQVTAKMILGGVPREFAISAVEQYLAEGGRLDDPREVHQLLDAIGYRPVPPVGTLARAEHDRDQAVQQLKQDMLATYAGQTAVALLERLAGGLTRLLERARPALER